MKARTGEVVSADGRRGTLHEDEGAAPGRVVVRFDDTRLEIPRELLSEDEGGWQLALRIPELPQREVVPIVEERLLVGKRRLLDRVTLSKRASERSETIQVPLEHEDVEVERVAIGRFVDTAPGIHAEGDTIIVPVLEERLVIEKKIFLKEEIRLTRHRRNELHVETVTLRSEAVEVNRTPVGRDEHVNE